MIVRLLEGLVAQGREEEFSAAARSFLRQSYGVAGLRRARIGRRVVDEHTEFVWISEWEDAADVISLDDDERKAPRFIEENPDLVESWALRHLEVFDDFMWDDEDEIHRLLLGGSR